MAIGVNSVSIGTCTAGQITVTANVGFPSGAINKEVKAIIINSAGAPVSPLFVLSNVAGDDYVGSVSGVPGGGPYKAKVYASWMVPGDSNKTSTNTSSCPLPPPPPPLPPPPPAISKK